MVSPGEISIGLSFFSCFVGAGCPPQNSTVILVGHMSKRVGHTFSTQHPWPTFWFMLQSSTASLFPMERGWPHLRGQFCFCPRTGWCPMRARRLAPFAATCRCRMLGWAPLLCSPCKNSGRQIARFRGLSWDEWYWILLNYPFCKEHPPKTKARSANDSSQRFFFVRRMNDKDGQSAGVAHIPKIIPMFAVQRCAKCHSTSAPHITAGRGYPVVSWILCSISCGTLKLPTSSQERAQRTFASCWCVRATATLWSFGLQAPCFNWDWANRHVMSCEKKCSFGWVSKFGSVGIAPGAEQAWESTASKHPPRYLIDSSRNPKSINSQTPRLRIIAVQHSKTQPEWKRWNAWA